VRRDEQYGPDDDVAFLVGIEANTAGVWIEVGDHHRVATITVLLLYHLSRFTTNHSNLTKISNIISIIVMSRLLFSLSARTSSSSSHFYQTPSSTADQPLPC
jgi:hypothetical protein